MKIRPSVRCQPSPTNSAGDRDHDARPAPSGRKAKNRCRICSLNAEKMFSKYLMMPGAEDRADQGADAAEDGHQHHLAGGRPLHALGAGQRVGDGEQRAGKARIHARDHEGGQRVGPRVEAGVVHAGLVGLDAAQHDAERRARRSACAT